MKTRVFFKKMAAKKMAPKMFSFFQTCFSFLKSIPPHFLLAYMLYGRVDMRILKKYLAWPMYKPSDIFVVRKPRGQVVSRRSLTLKPHKLDI